VEIVAKRNNCVLIEPTIVRGENLVEDDADRSALFQYMISNTDWRFKGGHNTKYMKSLTDITSKVIPLPYDFDFSGFVGASYTFPQSWSDAENIYDRDYLGYCRDNDESFRKNIELFKSKEAQITKTIADFKYLPENDKKETTKFINGFFTKINDTEDFLRLLKNECHPIDF